MCSTHGPDATGLLSWGGAGVDSDDVEDEESVETIKQLRVRELPQAHEEVPAVAGVAILNVADMYS